MQTYRDQLQNLQKLSYDKSQGILCKNTEFNDIPLRYLLGVLYINFQLVWEPVIGILNTYAHGMPINNFWEIFVEQLKFCDKQIKNPSKFEDKNISTDYKFLKELHNKEFKIESVPDFVNYRQLLWKAMCEFADIAEARNRDVTPLLISFIE